MIFSKFDLFIGGLYETNVTRNHLLSSRSYHSDSLTWCVKKQQPVAPLLQFFHICDDTIIWITYLLVAALIIALFYFFQQFEKSKYGFYRILIVGVAYATNTTQSYNIRNSAHRILFISCTLASVLESIVFTTFCFKVQTQPYMKREVRTVDDILSNDIQMIGDRFALMQLQQQMMVIVQFQKKNLFHISYLFFTAISIFEIEVF